LDEAIVRHLQGGRYFAQACAGDIPPHIMDTSSRKSPEFTGDAASFRNSFNHRALTHLHVFIMVAKRDYRNNFIVK
jgi:hypothetical protein